MRRLLSAWLLVALLPVSGAAAQENEAREHFDRGIELFNEGRFEPALVEFNRAYQLVPAAPALYNIGRVHEALGDSVAAVDAYERYLREADNVSAERRATVEAALRRQRARIARLVVHSNVEGAIVQIDGVDVATLPRTDPLRVTTGRIVVGVHAPGYEPRTREIEIAGGVEREVTIDLQPISGARGTVRIEADLPGVRILVDGELIGATPLNRTIPLTTGRHTIVAERRGYARIERHVDVEGGAEVTVELDLEQDAVVSREDLGRVRLHLPPAAFAVRVDGETMMTDSGSVELVAGEHEIVLEVEGREPFRTTVDVPAGGYVDLTPELRWSPMARAERIDSADAQRTIGWVLAIPGVAVFGAGLGLVLWNEGEVADTDREILQFNDRWNGCMITTSDGFCDSQMRAEFESLQSDQDGQDVVRILMIGATITGAAALAVGLAMLFTAPSEASIDDDARAGTWLYLGPGEAGLAGTF